MAPTYRERLRTEGIALAACGAAGSAALIALVPASRRWPLSTVAQLLAAGLFMERNGTRSVRRWMDEAVELSPGAEGGGEPTPLWMLPPIVAGLTASFVLLPRTGLPGSDLAGWDAGLRITGGCTLAGLMQAFRYEGIAAADERSRGRRYFRSPGSGLLGGTQLGFTRSA